MDLALAFILGYSMFWFSLYVQHLIKPKCNCEKTKVSNNLKLKGSDLLMILDKNQKPK